MDKTQFLDDRARVRAEFEVALHRHLPLGGRVGAWTPQEAFQHVLLTNQNSYSLLGRLFDKAKNLANDPPAEWPVRPELQEFPADQAFSIPAFPGTEPDPIVSVRELDDLAARLETRLQQLLELTDRFKLAALSFPHPLAGRLNFYEWLVFGVVHENLHLNLLQKDLGPA